MQGSSNVQVITSRNAVYFVLCEEPRHRDEGPKKSAGDIRTGKQFESELIAYAVVMSTLPWPYSGTLEESKF
jgi:hypothetical protein